MKNKLMEIITGNHKRKAIFIIVITCIMLSIVLPFAVKANSGGDAAKGNMFYVQVLNYSMPMVETSVFDEEDLAESSFSIKGKIFKFFGISVSNPISIVSKEIPCLKLNNKNEFKYVKNDSNQSFNEFKLEDKSISKEESNDSDKNLPNSTVSLYDPKLKKTINKAKPEVFIYHTHTTESYNPQNRAKENDSLDDKKNICAVGDVLTSELENNYGISVIHDKTVHNATAYTQSYQRSSVTVDKYLKKYKDFKLVIDMHRDSVSNKKAVTVKLNGENTAKFMFVMAKKNPHFNKNIAVVNKLLEISDRLYPNFCRGIYYYNYGTKYFHQDKSNNSMLIEVGANINSIDEAKNSAKYLARIIGEYINGNK